MPMLRDVVDCRGKIPLSICRDPNLKTTDIFRTAAFKSAFALTLKLIRFSDAD